MPISRPMNKVVSGVGGQDDLAQQCDVRHGSFCHRPAPSLASLAWATSSGVAGRSSPW
jgi:hypothetical protein